MIRFLINGTRADGERMAKRFGVNHVGFEPPGPDEGRIGEVVVGECDDEYEPQVAEWFNSDEVGPGGRFPPGSMLWFKNARPKVVVPGKVQ